MTSVRISTSGVRAPINKKALDAGRRLPAPKAFLTIATRERAANLRYSSGGRRRQLLASAGGDGLL